MTHAKVRGNNSSRIRIRKVRINCLWRFDIVWDCRYNRIVRYSYTQVVVPIGMRAGEIWEVTLWPMPSSPPFTISVDLSFITQPCGCRR